MFVASPRVVLWCGVYFSHCPTSLNPRHRSLFFNNDGDARRSTQTRNCPSHRYLPFRASIDAFFLVKTLGAINRHRSVQGQARPPHSTTQTTYVNPSYKPPSSRAYVRAEYQAAGAPPSTSSKPSTTVRPPSGPGSSLSRPHDVTIDGVVFESSERSLVRKDRASIPSSTQPFAQHHSQSYPLPNPLQPVSVLVCNRNSAGIN